MLPRREVKIEFHGPARTAASDLDPIEFDAGYWRARRWQRREFICGYAAGRRGFGCRRPGDGGKREANGQESHGGTETIRGAHLHGAGVPVFSPLGKEENVPAVAVVCDLYDLILPTSLREPTVSKIPVVCWMALTGRGDLQVALHCAAVPMREWRCAHLRRSATWRSPLPVDASTLRGVT